MAFSPEAYGAARSLIEQTMAGAGAIKGQDGAPGKSAYEIAKDNGFDGTEQEWLDSMVGDEGKSAYEVAKDNGFDGTEEEWLQSLTMEKTLTLAEYEALSDEEKNNGVTYYIDDMDDDESGAYPGGVDKTYVDDEITEVKVYVNSEVGEVKTYIDDEITAVTERANTTEQDVLDLDDRLTTAETDMVEIDEDLSSIEEASSYICGCLDGSLNVDEPDSGYDELANIRVGYDGTTYERAGDAVREQVGKIHEKINDILSDEIETVRGLGTVPNSVWKSRASVGISDSTIYLIESSTYITWYYVAEKTGCLYAGDDLLSLSYCAIAHGKNIGEWYEGNNGLTIDCEYTVRYRTSENNLPTVNNPLNVTKGDLIVITVPNPSGTLCLYGSIFNNKLSNSLKLNSTQIGQIKPVLAIDKVSETLYDISMGEYLMHYKYKNIGSYSAWNLLEISRGDEVLVTENTDILGPIREENNIYIGGGHGYENTKTMVIFVDGKPLSLNVGGSIDGNRIDIIHISDVYSSVDSSLKWERYYRLVFENNTLTIETNYKCVADEGASVKRATNGGIFGSPNDTYNALIVTNGFYPAPPTSEQTETTYLDDKTISVSYMYNNGGVITMDNIVGSEEDSYKCIMTIYGEDNPKRTKVYFLTIDSLKTFSKGQTIHGKFKLTFN